MLLSRIGLRAERRRVRAMQLDPVEFGEAGWKIIKEEIRLSRVLIDSSTDPQNAPRSTVAARQFGPKIRSHEGLWTHIIPMPSRSQAEALAVTLLGRIRPNPETVGRVLSQRDVYGIELRGASNVRALEKTTVGLGIAGRDLYIVGVVDSIAFGIGYGSLGEGWSQDRFAEVAQVQANKIGERLRSKHHSFDDLDR